MRPYYFLLGGYDLEMVEIKNFLEAHQLPFADNHLSWGATWSDYSSVIDSLLEQSSEYFPLLIGIELSGTKPPFANLIDHHNESSHLPTSLEQVASLLGVSLNRHQQLVAANDKGYIPAMRALGATEEEIQQIRFLDRQAQGVTKEMERQAQKDIRLINKCGNISIVQTNLPKFSPIADRLHECQLIVHNSNELTYYGKGATKLGELFADEVKAGRMYHGGVTNGFFGIGAGHFSSKDIKQFVDIICTYLEEN